MIRSSPRPFFVGIAPTPSRLSPEPPELDHTVDSSLCLISSPSRYSGRFPIAHWCSRAPSLLMFTGPSPGVPVSRRGRRTSPSPAVFHRRPSSTFPPKPLPRSRGSRSVSPSPPESSPPVRTCLSQSAGRRRGRAGAHLQIGILFQGPQRKNTETPPSLLLFHVIDAAVL
jgi:hypothetical protein